MTQPDNRTITYERACQDATRVRSFYLHGLVYALGNTTNVVVNAFTRQHGGNWWFQWPLIAWTVALAAHGITVAARRSWLGPAWEERKVREYLDADAVGGRR